MKNITYLITLLTAIIFFSSCEETITLDLNPISNKVAIDGLLTNKEGLHPVKVSRLASFYDNGKADAISNAKVTISDDLGNVYDYMESNLELGTYNATTAFIGTIGRKYTLNVTVEGKLYQAVDELFPVSPIDSLTWEIDENRRDNPDKDEPNRFYNVLLYTQEPPATVDYYLFKFYINDTIYIGHANAEVYYADDRYIQENIDGLEGRTYYEKDEKATFEMYRISRNAYLYYSDLDNNLKNDGGLFSPIPANVRSNISNGGLGLFQVASISSASIIVGE